MALSGVPSVFERQSQVPNEKVIATMGNFFIVKLNMSWKILYTQKKRELSMICTWDGCCQILQCCSLCMRLWWDCTRINFVLMIMNVTHDCIDAVFCLCRPTVGEWSGRLQGSASCPPPPVLYDRVECRHRHQAVEEVLYRAASIICIWSLRPKTGCM